MALLQARHQLLVRMALLAWRAQTALTAPMVVWAPMVRLLWERARLVAQARSAAMEPQWARQEPEPKASPVPMAALAL
jgi:hypothetical protein